VQENGAAILNDVWLFQVLNWSNELPDPPLQAKVNIEALRGHMPVLVHLNAATSFRKPRHIPFKCIPT